MPIIFDNTPSWARALQQFTPAYISEQQRGISNDQKQQGLDQNEQDLQSLIKTRDASTNIAQQRTDIERAGEERLKHGQNFDETAYIANRGERLADKALKEEKASTTINSIFQSTMEMLHKSSDPATTLGLMHALDVAFRDASDPEFFQSQADKILDYHRKTEELTRVKHLNEGVANALATGGMPQEKADEIKKMLDAGMTGAANATKERYEKEATAKNVVQDALERYSGLFQIQRTGMGTKQVADAYGALQRLSGVPPSDPKAVNDAIAQVSTTLTGLYGMVGGKAFPDVNGWSRGGNVPDDDNHSSMVAIAMAANPRSDFFKTSRAPGSLTATRTFDRELWEEAVDTAYKQIASDNGWKNPGDAIPKAPPGTDPNSFGIDAAIKAFRSLPENATNADIDAMAKKYGVDINSAEFAAALEKM